MTTIERAFQLARSGRVGTITELRAILRREGFDQIEFHLGGAFTRRQLLGLINAAAPAAGAPLSGRAPARAAK